MRDGAVMYELVLVSVLIGAGYWGWFFVRHRPHGTATFGLMQLGSAALAGLGLLGLTVDAPWLGVAGAVGIGGGVCLLVVAPMVRLLARRLIAAERTGIGLRLLDLAELLTPGSGIAEEKAVVRAMTEIREGRIDQTVDALTAAKTRAPADAQLAIDERITMLYVSAYRWGDAIAYAEAHLFAARPAPAEAAPGDGSLRSALGVAPPVWVDVLGAYGWAGNLEHAARMLVRLEDVCAGRDDAALWIHRARVVFLALAGRIDAVRALVAPRQARHMKTAARRYWLAVAHERHGDRADAVRAYDQARVRSRGRARAVIAQALAALRARTALEPTPLTARVSEVVARIEAAPLPPPIQVPRSRAPRATWLIIASLVSAFAITSFALGSTTDTGVLVRAGALVRGLVASGEWWRLVACVFLHVGSTHLALNAVAVLILGRLAEDLFGSVRTIAIFGVAGLAGALASYLASPAGLSAGASGALLGLVGAVLVEVIWHRSRHAGVWKRGMWGGLAVVAVGQLGYGFVAPLIDQWAHGAGLVAGALVCVMVSPYARWSRAGGYLGHAIALAFGALVITAGVLVARTQLIDSLTRSGIVPRAVDGVAIRVPADWLAQANQVFQPDSITVVKLVHQPRSASPRQVATWIAEETRRSTDELGALVTAGESIIALPPGWQGTELEAAPEDALGDHESVRVVLCGRAFGDQVIFIAIQIPDTIARAAPTFFAQLLASVGPA